jgi:hypothetical protein
MVLTTLAITSKSYLNTFHDPYMGSIVTGFKDFVAYMSVLGVSSIVQKKNSKIM